MSFLIGLFFVFVCCLALAHAADKRLIVVVDRDLRTSSTRDDHLPDIEVENDEKMSAPIPIPEVNLTRLETIDDYEATEGECTKFAVLTM